VAGDITDVNVVAARFDSNTIITALVDEICELDVAGVDGIFTTPVRLTNIN